VPGLGEDFFLEVQETIGNILAHPHAWTALGGDVRRCLTNRFPYGVIYCVEDYGVLVLAVMHLKRRPGYWRQRTR
jgi:hypothetical protein